MLRTVVLHGALATQFGSSFELDVKSPVEAIRALILQLRGFRLAFREGHYRILKARDHVADTLDIDEVRLRLGRAREIHIVPVIGGSTSGWGKILTGVAIIGLAIAAPYALGMAGGITGFGAGVASGVTLAGYSMTQVALFGGLIALGGIAQMLSPTPTLSGGSASQDRKESFLFGSAQNVTTQGGPVPVVCGEFVVGSVVVSSGLSTEEIGTDPTVNYGVVLKQLLTNGKT